MPSTDPYAFPLERIPDSEIATALNVPSSAVKAAREQRLREQRDPAVIGAILDNLPAPTLFVLGVLARGGGLMMMSEIARQLDRQMKRLDVELAFAPAIQELLVVAVESRWELGAGVALVAPANAIVTRLLSHVDVPELDDTAAFQADPRDDGRELLALCTALRSIDVKLTSDDRPHKSAIKRLAKQVGLAEPELESRLRTARFAGLLEPDDEGVLRPPPDALDQAARGRYGDLLLVGVLGRHLEHTATPLGLEVVDRIARDAGIGSVPAALALCAIYPIASRSGGPPTMSVRQWGSLPQLLSRTTFVARPLDDAYLSCDSLDIV